MLGVKNYNLATNQQGLISNVLKQALQRIENLPQGIQLIKDARATLASGFDIRAAQNHPLYDASGTDMFASAMQRLGNEGMQVNQTRGDWVAGTDSVNTAQYLENIANGMSKENAALKTWTGQISQKYGYGKVGKIETIEDITYVTFKK